MSDPWMIQENAKNITSSDSVKTEVYIEPIELTGNETPLGENIKDAIIENPVFSLQFEDNFATNPSLKSKCSTNNNNSSHRPLPDSETYLKGLERKLEKLRKDSKLVEALAYKRQDCLRSLLSDVPDPCSTSNSSLPSNDIFDLEAAISNTDSTAHEIHRYLQPVQPLTVGETVNIVNYDQLEQQRLQLESEAEEGEDSEPSTSR